MLLPLLTVTVSTCFYFLYFLSLNFYHYAAAAVGQNFPPLQKPFVLFNANTVNNKSESAKYKMTGNSAGILTRGKGEYQGLGSD